MEQNSAVETATHYSIRLLNFSSLHLLQLAFNRKDFSLPLAFKRTLYEETLVVPAEAGHKEDIRNLNFWQDFLK